MPKLTSLDLFIHRSYFASNFPYVFNDIHWFLNFAENFSCMFVNNSVHNLIECDC